MDDLKRFLAEIREREERAHRIPGRMERLKDLLATVLAAHGLGHGLRPQISMDEAIQILGVFDEGREAYKNKNPDWFKLSDEPGDSS